jgi:hypothetical protein
MYIYSLKLDRKDIHLSGMHWRSQYAMVATEKGGMSIGELLVGNGYECEIVQETLKMITRVFPKFVRN